MIELSHITKNFETDSGRVQAIRDVSLSIGAGEIYGIIGFSGAGKSTLVRCINMIETPQSGMVVVDGVELTQLSPRELRAVRKRIGMIFQHFNLMSARTVYENVAYPLRRSGLSKQQIRDKVQRLLALVDIADKELVYPSQLSGGQKQRVAIARALANDPKVLLCDEATSALDPQTTKSILQLLKKLNEQMGITVVMITHEMAVVKEICNRVAVMEDGEVVEEGDTFSIFANPKQPATRDFIRTTSNLWKIDEQLSSGWAAEHLKVGELVARLSYVEKNTFEPLISGTSRRFGIDLNIIYADVGMIGGAPVGGTVAIFSGDRTRIEAALEALREKNVGVEVVTDANVS